MSLPSETYRTQHSPKFMCAEDGTRVSQSLGEFLRTPLSDDINSNGSYQIIGSYPLWKYPLATFDFAKDDERFPIDIEAPFETFQTVLWDMWMICPVTLSPLCNQNQELTLVQERRRAVCKGIERVSRFRTSLSTLSFHRSVYTRLDVAPNFP